MRRLLVLSMLSTVLVSCGGDEGGTTTVAATNGATSTTTTTVTMAPAGGGPVTFEEASDLVIADLIGGSEPDLPTIVFGRPEPLVAGDVVTAHRPLPDEQSRVIAAVDGDAYLFWADDVAGAYFAHPVRFALVDAATGGVTVTPDEWYAELNGETLWTDDDDYWDPANWVYESGVGNVEAAGELTAVLAGHRPDGIAPATLAAGGRSEAILINGWHPGQTHRGEMAYDVNAMKDAVESLGAVGRAFSRPDRAADRRALETAFADARERLVAGDTLFVYLTGHGGILPNGTAFADTITEDHLKGWLTGFAPCVKIVVQVHACHSGGFLDSLQQVADLTIVSTSEDGFSMADVDGAPGPAGTNPDPNPSDRGSEHTSGMVEGLQQIAASEERRTEIQERIADSGESFLQAAAAQSFGHSVSVDFGAINGLTRPATRMGNEAAISCNPPVEGDYTCRFTIDTDPRDHGPHILMPNELVMPIVRLSDELDRLRADGPPPFVPVEGVFRPEIRAFNGTGAGTVAGFTDVEVALDLILTYGGAEGTYEMGTGGRLPGAESITYAVACIRAGDRPVPEADETPEAFYEQFVAAMRSGDAAWPLSRLHPSVIDTFGDEACRIFIEGLFEPTLEIEVTSVGDPVEFTYEVPGGTIGAPGALPVGVDITVDGATFGDTTHLVPIDGLLHWFAACAD